jgi:hypothetical protein
MIVIPSDILNSYNAVLIKRAIPATHHAEELLGYSDVRTNNIYSDCVPSKTIEETKSPFDF